MIDATRVDVITQTSCPGLHLLKRGKVRDMFDVGESLLIVGTDRLSAFDVVVPQGIPCKGMVLTQIADYWFDGMSDIVPNHLISSDVRDFPRGRKLPDDVIETTSQKYLEALERLTGRRLS